MCWFFCNMCVTFWKRGNQQLCQNLHKNNLYQHEMFVWSTIKFIWLFFNHCLLKMNIWLIKNQAIYLTRNLNRMCLKVSLKGVKCFLIAEKMLPLIFYKDLMIFRKRKDLQIFGSFMTIFRSHRWLLLLLAQWFPTGVPQHTRVMWAGARGAANC